MRFAQTCLFVALVSGCSTASSAVRDEPVYPRESARLVVSAQLAAERALTGRVAPRVWHDTSAVIELHRREVAPGVSLVRFETFGVGHGRVFSFLAVRDQRFRLGGFPDPDVGAAWAALRDAGGLACEAVAEAVLHALDENGGRALVRRDDQGGFADSSLMTAADGTWPDDTVVHHDSFNLSVMTVLSRDREDYPVPSWTPTVYAVTSGPHCTLLGWSRRVGSSLRPGQPGQ